MRGSSLLVVMMMLGAALASQLRPEETWRPATPRDITRYCRLLLVTVTVAPGTGPVSRGTA